MDMVKINCWDCIHFLSGGIYFPGRCNWFVINKKEEKPQSMTNSINASIVNTKKNTSINFISKLDDFKNILKRWALAKGLSFKSESDFNRWAYFVSQKIKNEGTKLYLAGGRKDILSQPITNFAERFTNRITSQFEIEITNKIFVQ